MRLDVQVVYMVRAKRRSDRGGMSYADVVATVPVEIKEVPLGSAPVAVMFGKGTGAVEVRNMDGHFLVRHKVDGAFPDARPYLEQCAGISRGGVFPDTQTSQHNFPENDPGWTYRPDPAKREDRVQTCRERAANLVLLDGQLWRRVPEPVYSVKVDLERERCEVEVAYASQTTGQFSLAQAHLIGPFLAALTDGRVTDVELPVVDVLDGGDLRFDCQEAALRHVGSIVAGYARDYIGRKPFAEMAAFGRLRDLSEGLPDPAPQNGGGLRQALEAFVLTQGMPDHLGNALRMAYAACDVRDANALELESSFGGMAP